MYLCLTPSLLALSGQAGPKLPPTVLGSQPLPSPSKSPHLARDAYSRYLALREEHHTLVWPRYRPNHREAPILSECSHRHLRATSGSIVDVCARNCSEGCQAVVMFGSAFLEAFGADFTSKGNRFHPLELANPRRPLYTQRGASHRKKTPLRLHSQNSSDAVVADKHG